MKNSFSIFEIILTIMISSIVIIYTMSYAKKIVFLNENSQEIELKKINLLFTKAFLQKHKNELNKIAYDEGKIYFDNKLLLEDVKDFQINVNDFVHVKIDYNLIKQEWSF